MTPDIVPSIEQQVHDALHEVAESVTLDQRPAPWPDSTRSERRGRRTRTLATVVIAATLATGAVVAMKATRSTTSSRRPTSTTPASRPFVDDGTLTTPRFYRNGLTVLLPPPEGTQPRVNAAEAYEARSGYPWRQEPPSPHLVLADVTIFDDGTAHSDGSVTPLIDNRLAWVVTYTDVPVGSLRQGGVAPRVRPRGETTSPTTPLDPSARSGEMVLALVDATSGEPLEAEGLPGSFSTAPTMACPARVPLRVPPHQLAGTDSTFVPGDPIELLTGRYHGLNQPEPAGRFADSARLAPLDIVAALNAPPSIRKTGSLAVPPTPARRSC